jgi:hypothetical protein
VGIAARPVETLHQTDLHGIAAGGEHDRDRGCCRFGGKRRGLAAGRHQYGDAAPDEIGRHLRQPVVLPLRPMIFDRDILALDKARFPEAFAKRGDKSGRVVQRPAAQITNHGEGLLRTHRARPCRQPCAHDTEKFPSPHATLLAGKTSQAYLSFALGSKELLCTSPFAAP